ncbi:MAG: FkbM family methyltransferase [Alphaproteobacteria bacterium]|jgi:FkbM family methyltransferase|nr:FkbM family methyltransferase [Alphaproteobacteria bacterium]
MSRSVGRFAAALARLATAPLHPWRRAMAQAFAAQRLTPHWTIDTDAGRLVFAGPSGRSLHDAHGFNRDEPETVAWIDSLPQEAVLWDVGANVGVYAIYAAKRGIRVLAFEPAAATLAVLTRNIELNGVSDRVAAYGVALSNQTKLDALYMDAARTEPGHAVHSFGTRRTVAGVIEGGFQQATIGYAADAFAAQFAAPKPTHVKLDVDGIEAEILEGAAGLLRETVREIMVEIYDDMNPEQARRIRDTLAASGFVEKPTAYPEGRNKLFLRA